MEFWHNQRILITGGTGFLGSAVTRQLKQYDNSTDVYSVGKHHGNLTNPEMIRRHLKIFNPTIVIHLAAVVGGIGANRDRPAEFFYQNALMGIQLIHECYVAKIPKMVVVGTICAYPKFTPVPFTETELWNGYPEETNAAYGLAKKMLLVQAQAYRQQYGFNTIYLLPTNLYGPGDEFDPASSHVIPALIRKCVQAKQAADPFMTVWGDGTPTREFLYVDDAAEGILLATEHYNKPDPVNLGTGQETSIAAIMTMIADKIGYKGEVIYDTTKPNGQPRRCLNTDRAKNEFGFVAKTPLQVGLQKTIDWYLKHSL